MKPKPSEAVRAKFNDEALPELINVEGILNLEDPVRRATYNIIKEATRNEIIAYLEELEKEEEKWISVKDKLPKFDGKYLCVINQTQECKNTWVYQKVVDMIFCNWILINGETVTHWRKLPNNPTHP